MKLSSLGVAGALTAVAALLAACGGKVADDGRTAGPPTVVTKAPPPPVPDPDPLDPPEPGPGPGPTPPSPPPPLADAGVTAGDRLVGGSPQCSPHVPAGGASCRTLVGYTPKCEYDVTGTDGGTCRWFCYCTTSESTTTGYEWICNETGCR